MACPHGHGPPSACSQCLGAPARRVDTADGIATIDGVTARPVDPTSGARNYYVRGGRRAGRRKRL